MIFSEYYEHMHTGGIFQRNVNRENLWHGEEGLRPWILQVLHQNHHKQKNYSLDYKSDDNT